MILLQITPSDQLMIQLAMNDLVIGKLYLLDSQSDS